MSEIEVLEAKIRELRKYLLKLEQLHEKGEVTDEVYQELKNEYSKELKKYEFALEELKKRLEVERRKQVVTVTQSLQASASPEPILATKKYPPSQKIKVITRTSLIKLKNAIKSFIIIITIILIYTLVFSPLLPLIIHYDLKLSLIMFIGLITTVTVIGYDLGLTIKQAETIKIAKIITKATLVSVKNKIKFLIFIIFLIFIATLPINLLIVLFVNLNPILSLIIFMVLTTSIVVGYSLGLN
ncbi:MAG: hypothetical protein QW291_09640 [Thermofilaceae archaeon]